MIEYFELSLPLGVLLLEMSRLGQVESEDLSIDEEI